MSMSFDCALTILTNRSAENKFPCCMRWNFRDSTKYIDDQGGTGKVRDCGRTQTNLHNVGQII